MKYNDKPDIWHNIYHELPTRFNPRKYIVMIASRDTYIGGRAPPVKDRLPCVVGQTVLTYAGLYHDQLRVYDQLMGLVKFRGDVYVNGENVNAIWVDASNDQAFFEWYENQGFSKISSDTVVTFKNGDKVEI